MQRKTFQLLKWKTFFPFSPEKDFQFQTFSSFRVFKVSLRYSAREWFLINKLSKLTREPSSGNSFFLNQSDANKCWREKSLWIILTRKTFMKIKSTLERRRRRRWSKSGFYYIREIRLLSFNFVTRVSFAMLPWAFRLIREMINIFRKGIFRFGKVTKALKNGVENFNLKCLDFQWKSFVTFR